MENPTDFLQYHSHNVTQRNTEIHSSSSVLFPMKLDLGKREAGGKKQRKMSNSNFILNPTRKCYAFFFII